MLSILEDDADSCLHGQVAHVVNCTGRYVRLISYRSPKQSSRGPIVIVSAYIKLKGTNDKTPTHEPPYMEYSKTSLLLEY